MLYLRSQGHLLRKKRKTCERSPLITWSCHGAKKEGYQSPYIPAIHQITGSPVLVDVLYALGLSLSYPGILDFEKYTSVSAIEFTDTLSEEESMKCFLQFIADNFDHNQDTTTGACTTHVMGLISSRYPKSDILSTEPIVKQTITSEINDLANVRGLVKMYEKPSISKFKNALVDGYADTMIVQQALNEATKKTVVVHCIDTDVLIALLHYFYISGNSIVMTKKQGLCSIEKVVSALDDDLRQCYWSVIAISGCNTVSATFGMGKLKAFNKFKESFYWRSAMKALCDDDLGLIKW